MSKLKLKTYRFKVTHDNGTETFSILASSESVARRILANVENCPQRAIKRARTSVVIVRGCKFRVLKEEASQIIKEEQSLIRDEWSNNSLME